MDTGHRQHTYKKTDLNKTCKVHSKQNGKVERKEYLLFLGRGKQAQSLKAENAEGGDGLEAIHRSIGMYQDKTQFNQET